MSEPAARETLRVGIVGCGAIARAHALSYQNNAHAEWVGVVDIDPVRAAAFAAEYGTSAYGSCRELLEHEPDLVSIATPPGNHTEVAGELLESGCSVLLEKPPTTTLADLDVLAGAEKLSLGSVYVVFQHRHGSGARRAHRLLQAGALGTPQVAVCETLWYRPDAYFLPEWRGNWVGEGGGPTLGHGIHQIDLLLHLLGPWETIDGRAARIARTVEFEDVSLAILTFASGAVGTVVTSLLSPRELSRIRIDTTGGTHSRLTTSTATATPTGPGRPRQMRQRLPLLDATPVGRTPAVPEIRSRQAAKTSGPPLPGRMCPATTRPRSISWSTTCSPGAATKRRWPVPVRRWSSSLRSTHRPSSAKPFTDGISVRLTASTTASTAGCPPRPSPLD